MKTLRGWVNLLVSQKVPSEGWLKKDYLAFTHWYSLQQREIFEACKVTNISSNFYIFCFEIFLKKPRMWWRNRAGKICAAGWDATWRCLVDLITRAADSRSGWHYPGTWHPHLRECQRVFRKQVLADWGRFVTRERKWQRPLAAKVICIFFFGCITYQSSVRFAIDRYARPNEVPRVMRELQLRCGKIKFFCPSDGWGTGDRTSCPFSSAHPPAAFMSNPGLAHLYWSAYQEKVGVTLHDHRLGVYWKLIHSK